MTSEAKARTMGVLWSCFCNDSMVDIHSRRLKKLSQIGEGGFSYVYVVEDVATTRKFALKKITCHDDDSLQDALREVELYRLFDSPYIIQVIDYVIMPVANNTQAQDVLVLLPFYRRGTLQDLIETKQMSNEHFEERELLLFFRDICRSLYKLHHYTPPNLTVSTPLAHRDVKPGNILLTDDGKPVLMDFGSMAKAKVEVTSRREALALQDLASERCSMPYRAPELFDVVTGFVIDERVDIWSLGCLLYAMAYHYSPFEASIAEQGGSLALAVISGKIAYPSDDPYSQSLRDLCELMLVTNHVKRPHIEAVIAKVDEVLLMP